MKLGQLEFHILVAGRFGLDGGAMFGVIPKPMWEKKVPADSRNRITLAMNCLLIRAGGKNILVETGAGDKMNAKFRDIYVLEGPHLTESLLHYGVHTDEVDIVINTHLHFDHCGGNTRVRERQNRPHISERALRGPSRRISSTPRIQPSATAPAISRRIMSPSRLQESSRFSRMIEPSPPASS